MSGRKNKFSVDDKIRIIIPLLREDREPSLLARIARGSGVSAMTLRRWVARYREGGIAALKARYRGPGGKSRLHKGYDEALEIAEAARRQDPFLSVRKIIKVIEGRRPELKGLIKRSTLQRRLEGMRLTRRDLAGLAKLGGRRNRGRYRKEHRMEQVQCDVKVLPQCLLDDGTPGRLYLQLWVDNHSRKILSYLASPKEDTRLALMSLRTLLEKYGRIGSIYTDNGPIYRSEEMGRACRLAGAELKFARPYSPEGKGMIERRNLMLNDVENQIKGRCLPRGPVDCFIEQWIREYNDTPSKALGGLSPNQSFELDSKPLEMLPQDIIENAFSREESRVIGKDASVSVGGEKYRADMSKARAGDRATFMIKPDGTVWQVQPDGGLAQIQPYRFGPDVDREDFKARPPGRAPAADEPPALMEAYIRDAFVREGRFTTEEAFQREFREMLGAGKAGGAEGGGAPAFSPFSGGSRRGEG